MHTDVNKNASLIITEFSAMVYKSEQPRTAYLCRDWARLENGFDLICRWRVIPTQRTHDGIMRQWLMISKWICTQFLLNTD